MGERPEFGTAMIRCGRMRCKWRGFETMLARSDHALGRRACRLHGLCHQQPMHGVIAPLE